MVFAQDVENNAGCEYAFFGGFGAFATLTGRDYNAISPTADGRAAGITVPELNVDDWHDTYSTFPSFLKILATVAEGEFDGDEDDCNIPDSTVPSCVGDIAAIGGAEVTILPPAPPPEPLVVTPSFTG